MFSIAAGSEKLGLSDPVFAFDAPRKRYMPTNPSGFLGRPIRNLGKMVDTKIVANLLVLCANSFDQLEIVGLPVERGIDTDGLGRLSARDSGHRREALGGPDWLDRGGPWGRARSFGRLGACRALCLLGFGLSQATADGGLGVSGATRLR